MILDDTDRAIINGLQDGFPLSPRPFAEAAKTLGLSERDLIRRVGKLVAAGVLSRFGPIYHAEKLGGGLTLAAIAAPEDRFDAVADIVNAYPEVAHNYRREHKLNMWFVVATETPERIGEVLDEIAKHTGLVVHNFPREAEYYIGLRLSA